MIQSPLIPRLLFCCFLATSPAACGGNTSGSFAGGVPYHPGDVTVVGDKTDDGTVPAPGGCASAECSTAVGQCENQDAADVVVDAQGKVVDVICYKPDLVVTNVPAAGPSGSASVGNNALLVIDGANDGVDVAGDVTLAGNNDAIYGEGPAVSVIGGTVDIQKNNAKVRGVRIEGDVTIDKNNTKLVFCVIDGNLTISGNNTTVANCDVYGTTTVTGQDTVLAGDRFEGPQAFTGGNMVCSADVAFTDANGDHVVDVSELGAAVTCGSH